LLLPLLQSTSYRNTLLDAAISAISAQCDAADIAPLRSTLKARKTEMTSRGFGEGLVDLASLCRNCDKKAEGRGFIAAYLDDKKRDIQIGAIRALGTLEDSAAIPLLQTFAGASSENPSQKAAADALETIRSGRQRGDNVRELRQTVLDLQKEVEKLRRDMNTMQRKTEAKKNGRASSAKNSNRQ